LLLIHKSIPTVLFSFIFSCGKESHQKSAKLGFISPLSLAFGLWRLLELRGPQKKVNFIRSWPGLRVKMWESRFLAKRFFLSYHYALSSLRSPHEMKLPKKSNQVPLSANTNIHIYIYPISGHKYLSTSWIELR